MNRELLSQLAHVFRTLPSVRLDAVISTGRDDVGHAVREKLARWATDSAAKCFDLSIELPGNLFGLPSHERVYAWAFAAIRPREHAAQFEALAAEAGYACTGVYPGGTSFWMKRLLIRAFQQPPFRVSDPVVYLTPDEVVSLDMASFAISPAGQASRDAFTRKLQQRLSIPWSLGIRLYNVHIASAIECERLLRENAESIETQAREPAPSIQIEREGDGWRVRAFGREAHLQDLVGFRYISLLIANAGKPVPMAELIEHANGLVDSPGVKLIHSTQRVLDGDAYRAVKHQLAELSRDIEAAEKSGDLTQAELYRQEFYRLLAQIKRDTTPRGKSRAFPSNVDKMRARIFGGLKTAYAKLEKAGFGELKDHLQAYISAVGSDFVYSPPRNMLERLR